MLQMTDLIDVYAQRLKAAGRSHYTISTRCRVLRRADLLLPQGLDHACGEEITDYLARCEKDWTRITYYSALNGYYKTLVRAGKLTLNPMDAVDRPKPGDSTPNPVTTAEFFTALELSPNSPWRGAVILGGYAGLRCAEMAALLRTDVTRERIHVRRGKGGRARYIPTHPAVWDFVAECNASAVLVDEQGEAFTPERLTGSQGRHWQRIGMPEVHLHRFRHWFGTTLADNGVGLEVIRELMGHRSVATTQGYVRVSQARRETAISQLPNRTSEPVTTWLGRPTASAALPMLTQ